MKKFIAQFIRFAVVGAGNMVLDTLIYIALTRGFHFFEENYLFAAFLSFVISSTNSFYWNKKWTFKDTKQFHHKQLMAFYFASASALGINQFVLWFLVEQIHLFDIFAKVIASFCAGGLNFSLQRFWIFRKKENESEPNSVNS
jgi:putative flippase GtrA